MKLEKNSFLMMDLYITELFIMMQNERFQIWLTFIYWQPWLHIHTSSLVTWISHVCESSGILGFCFPFF